jgi:hypothetical protein
MNFIVAGCALLVAVLVNILLDVTDAERQQKSAGIVQPRVIAAIR